METRAPIGALSLFDVLLLFLGWVVGWDLPVEIVNVSNIELINLLGFKNCVSFQRLGTQVGDAPRTEPL